MDKRSNSIRAAVGYTQRALDIRMEDYAREVQIPYSTLLGRISNPDSFRAAELRRMVTVARHAGKDAEAMMREAVIQCVA